MSAKTSENSQGVFEPFDSRVVPLEVYTKGARFGMSYQHLSSFGGGSQISLSLEVLEPGRQANPKHYHMLEEEHIMVLEGELTLLLGDREYLMSAHHYVCFPAGQQVGHAIQNRSDKACRYLVLGTPNENDVSVCTDTGRVAVKLLTKGFRGDAEMKYWDGIDTGEPQSPRQT